MENHDPETGTQLAYANNPLGQEVKLTEWPDKSSSVTVTLMNGIERSVHYLPEHGDMAWSGFQELKRTIDSYEIRKEARP